MNPSIVALAMLAASGYLAFAQGIIDFRNNNLDEPPDRRVRLPQGEGVIGTQFVAQLYYASDAPNRDANLNAPAAVVEGPARFRAPGAALPGTWVGGLRQLIGTAPGEPRMYVVRAWDSSFGDGSYEAGWHGGGILGQSAPFEYTVPRVFPPDAFFMLNFVGFTIDVVPEPSTLMLGGVAGLAILWFLRHSRGRFAS